jgi:hypothetical protein
MLEILQNFESAIGGPARLSPWVLIGAGSAAVLVGLFVWLGGLGFRRLLLAVAGAVSGGVLGFFIVGRSIIWAVVLAGAAATTATLIEKLFFAALAAALAAALGFVVLARPYMGNSQSAMPTDRDKTPAQGTTMSMGDSIEKIGAHLADLCGQVRKVCAQMPARNWVIIAVLAAVAIVAGFSLRRLTPALCCSVIGTMLIFAGMISLLWHKGSAPVGSIRSKPSFYAAVFVGMTVFGTIEQLLLCRHTRTQSQGKEQAGSDPEKAERTRRNRPKP